MQIIVVGGGAAGFFAAIACAEQYPYTQVTLLEAGQQVLTKVKISGGGRCNVTHACFDPAELVQHYPRGGKALRGAFSRFQPQDTIAWFAARGVKLNIEADGRIFPVTNCSATIVDCLLQAARLAGVKVRTGAAVTAVTRMLDPSGTDQSQFLVELQSGECLRGDRLLLATGSSPQGWRIAARLGHRIEPPVPSLFTFKIADSRLQDLAGISVNPVRLSLWTGNRKPLDQTGALLITHWGMSGPAVLKLSAWGARELAAAGYKARLGINWLPGTDLEALRQQILVAKTQWGRRTISNHSPLELPQRLWQRLCSHVGIQPDQHWAALSHKTLNRLLQEMTQASYEVQGKGVFKDEFVTCGGVDLKQVDFKTLQSRCCPGLFFAGEVLDIDGVTGGFNFQNAWTTAWIAAQAMGLAQHEQRINTPELRDPAAVQK